MSNTSPPTRQRPSWSRMRKADLRPPRPALVTGPAAELLREIIALYRESKALPPSDRRPLEDQISTRSRQFWALQRDALEPGD